MTIQQKAKKEAVKYMIDRANRYKEIRRKKKF